MAQIIKTSLQFQIILLLVASAGCQQETQPNPVKTGTAAAAESIYDKPIVDAIAAKVISVEDGDTIKVVADDNEPLTVRLECIDAPEGNEPFSPVAKQALSDLVLNQPVTLKTTGQDGRGRTLAFVFSGDVNVNAKMIESGYARHFKRYSKSQELADLESAARMNQLNIWSDSKPAAAVATVPQQPQSSQAETTSPQPLGPIRLLAWNVESDGSDIQVIAEQLGQWTGYSIYGLSEVDARGFEAYRQALGDHFKSIQGSHRENDHLQLIYDDSQLELLGWNEIDEVQGIRMNRPDRALRSPLLARFRQRETGAIFQVVLNHLARGNAEFRTQQAVGLREWGRQQTLPTLAIGDFNFDYVFATKQGNSAFDEFLRDNIWKWIEPIEMIDSNWYDADGDRVDDYPGSLLDFVFVAGPARDLDWKCDVIVREGDFPDDNRTSDHRPVRLTLVANP